MLRLRGFAADDSRPWDDLVARSVNGTFLHTRRYLGYHGERFVDRSLLVERDGLVVGVLPLALDPADQRCAVSHPGITYGGLVHDDSLFGDALLDVLSQAFDCLRSHGVARVAYRPVPAMYHRRAAADDVYALFRLGAVRDRCQLSTMLELRDSRELPQRRRRGVRRAEVLGVEPRSGADQLPAMWAMLERNLAERHGVRPVHTLHEMKLLATLFPAEIRCVVGYLDDVAAAGTLLYDTGRVVHTQYLASTPEGRAASALDLVVERCIGDAAEAGRAVFDFGVSTSDGGRLLNSGLHEYKRSFGAGSAVYESWTVELS
jgi:CelD/BcsL family acetyltransferase involved in cellulose biosynthesis